MSDEKKTTELPVGWTKGNWDAPTPEEREQFWRLERKYRIGAAHATEALANALEHGARSLEDAQRIARAFANLVQDGRLRDSGPFEINQLIVQAIGEARENAESQES